MEKNLTTGSVFKNILQFSIPFFISYFLQTLYGTADMFIIGQFNGTDSTTAVSIGSQVMHMITMMLVGLSMGSTVLIARAVGSEKPQELSSAIGNTITLFVAISLAFMLCALLLLNSIVSLMSTPPEAVAGTRAYLTICFAGIPFITAYNVISSVFRGMGDSKSPMYFVAIACVSNILLDCLFIGALKMGPAGAALGTTVSQAISVAVSLLIITRSRSTGIRLTRGDLIAQRNVIGSILKGGIPVALQECFIQFSFLVVAAIANKRGLNDAAAVGIVEKFMGILFLMPSAMLSTVSALAAQNIGAGKPERARQTLWYAILLAAGFGLLAVGAMILWAEPVVSLFSKSSDVIHLGGQYMRGYVFDCILAGIQFCFNGYFCACGMSGMSFLNSFIGTLLARLPVAYLASAHFPSSLFPMGLATTSGSAVSLVICIIIFIRLRRRENKITAA